MRETTDKEEGQLGGGVGRNWGMLRSSTRATPFFSRPGARASQGGNTKLESKQGWCNIGVDISKASTECAPTTSRPPIQGRWLR